MNERIKELAEQAMDYADENFKGESTWYEVSEWYEVYESKFAELIVRECAMLVEGFEITQEVALDEYVDYEASTVLKQHFGVE